MKHQLELLTDDQRRIAAKLALHVVYEQEKLDRYLNDSIGRLHKFDDLILNDQKWPFTVECLEKQAVQRQRRKV